MHSLMGACVSTLAIDRKRRSCLAGGCRAARRDQGGERGEHFKDRRWATTFARTFASALWPTRKQ